MLDHSVAEPIDLADVRSYLAMDPDDQSEDPLLTDCIAFCRDRLESILPYRLAERELRESKDLCTWCLMPDITMPLQGPVLEIYTVDVVLRDGTAVSAERGRWWIFDEVLHIDVRGIMDDHRRDMGKDCPVPPPVGVTVDYRCGSHVPPVIKNALLMMVRSRYERRDEDPLTDAIRAMVYPETRPCI